MESLLKKPGGSSDGWKSMRGIDDDDDDQEAWFDDEDEELLSPGGGESLATQPPCMIAAASRLSPDCDQISQYLDKGQRIPLSLSVCL